MCHILYWTIYWRRLQLNITVFVMNRPVLNWPCDEPSTWWTDRDESTSDEQTGHHAGYIQGRKLAKGGGVTFKRQRQWDRDWDAEGEKYGEVCSPSRRRLWSWERRKLTQGSRREPRKQRDFVACWARKDASNDNEFYHFFCGLYRVSPSLWVHPLVTERGEGGTGQPHGPSIQS